MTSFPLGEPKREGLWLQPLWWAIFICVLWVDSQRAGSDLMVSALSASITTTSTSLWSLNSVCSQSYGSAHKLASRISTKRGNLIWGLWSLSGWLVFAAGYLSGCRQSGLHLEEEQRHNMEWMESSKEQSGSDLAALWCKLQGNRFLQTWHLFLNAMLL